MVLINRMDLNFDRKKTVNLWGLQQNYAKHLQRLQNVMNSTQSNQGKSLRHLLQAVHQNKGSPRELKGKSSERNGLKFTTRQTQIKEEMSLPKLKGRSKKNSPRKTSPITYDRLMQNVRLYNKITTVESKYSTRDFERSFQRLTRIKNSLKKKTQLQTTWNLQRIFQHSTFHQSLYPDTTFTHIHRHRSRKVSEELRLKFEILPLLQLPEVMYGLEVRTEAGRVLGKSKLVDAGQLRKDVFVFRMPRAKAEKIVVEFTRYRNHTGNPQGIFMVERGHHVATELKSASGIMPSQFLCYTSWNHASKKEGKFKIVLGQGFDERLKENMFIGQLEQNEEQSQISSIDHGLEELCDHQSLLLTTNI